MSDKVGQDAQSVIAKTASAVLLLMALNDKGVNRWRALHDAAALLAERALQVADHSAEMMECVAEVETVQ